MSDIPSIPYEDLWHERQIRSVANLTRSDGQEFLPLAGEIPVKTTTSAYPLERANEALDDLERGSSRARQCSSWLQVGPNEVRGSVGSDASEKAEGDLAERNLKLVRRHYAAFASGDLDGVVDGLDEDVAINVHDEHGKAAERPIRGRAGARTFFEGINAAITNFEGARSNDLGPTATACWPRSRLVGRCATPG